MILRTHNREVRFSHWHYPLFEGVSTVCLLPLMAQHNPINYVSVITLLFMLALLVLAFIDAEYFILPDLITMPLWVMGLVVNGYAQGLVALQAAFLSSLGAYLSLRLFAESYHWLTGRVGLGRGDIKLFGVLGAWLGFAALPIILWIASISGLLWSLIGISLKRLAYDTCIPFGPFLVGSTWCYLILFKPF